ncbi:MAG: phosphonopyruvate decarboxylase [Candidatus Magasanikbacteria bacterium RIFOXYA2_FULL_44_8]|uniref:Phosphonopyruvate decarboxylase n=1 Tax=Candidatus Magasanikbacteria bacterium RIFOXYA2_FULL_44_8 TaxID=1798696 RepID=A0A1F6NKR9_9BACT|nr:MAG: phosphonopyruvate decarboxylase [Candidatus Magasanikbacteria bacterium RIFOXYA2_FULL_44_8]
MQGSELVEILRQNKLLFLTGVPCSYLKNFLNCVADDGSGDGVRHVKATSEGEAIGIAAGYHLATGRTPVVYMQNSGLGNAINPLTSLMDRVVYSMPAILFVTWRGEPGHPDEPQHKKMGEVTIELLKILGIPYEFADQDVEKTKSAITKLMNIATQKSQPVALIFKSGLFEKTDRPVLKTRSGLTCREQILELLLEKIGACPVVATTGKTSREIFEIRSKNNQSHQSDFLTVGSMGCAAGIALGVALQTKDKIFIIDGDGAVLMKMGTLATVGYYQPKNLVHIIIDNGAYESTGGQLTVSATLRWGQLLKSVGYKKVLIVKTKKQLAALDFERPDGPMGVVISSAVGSRPDLGRPSVSPVANKNEFMKFIQEKN